MIRGDAFQKVIYAVQFVILLTALIAPAPVHAIADIEVPMPTLEQFAHDVINRDPDELRGLYIPGVLADDIVDQPEGMPAYVSSEDGVLTRFELTEGFGSYGLLAHNTLAGNDFSELEEGQRIYLVFGDGTTEIFVVMHLLRYQALTPSSITSDFVELGTGDHFSASELFLKVYDRPGQVILQTCIDAEGDASWGRMFIIAVPLSEYDAHAMPENSVSH